MVRKNMKHKWNVTEETFAYYFSQFKLEGLDIDSMSDLAKLIGITPNSFYTRSRGYTFLATDGKEGFPNVSKQAREVFALHELAKDKPEFQENMANYLNRELKIMQNKPKRGRPRKKVTPEVVAEKPATKAKRGRPRKVKTEVVSERPKAKRGRPRKVKVEETVKA